MSGLKDKLPFPAPKIPRVAWVYRTWFFILAILALVLGVVNMIHIRRMPEDSCIWIDTPDGVVVESVERGGSAEMAGIQPNDIILQIDGENTVNSSVAQAVLDRQPIGKPVSYVIFRNGEFHTYSVRIVSRGLSDLYIIMTGVGFIFLAVGLWLGSLRPLDGKAHVLFYLFLCFMVFWALNIVPSTSGHLFQTIFFIRTLAFVLIPVFFLYFFLIYPKTHPWLIMHRWPFVLLFAPAFLVTAWYFLAVVFRRPFEPPIGFRLGVVLWGMYFVVGIVRGVSNARIEPDIQIRQQMRILLWGITFGLVVPFVLTLLEVLHKFPYGHYFLPLLVVIPLSFAYSVVRHRFMDIEVITKQSFVYTLLTGLVFGFYSLTVQGLGKFLSRAGGFTESLVLLLSTLMVSLVFLPVRHKLQKLVDRAFYREAYDYRKTLKNAATALNTLMEPDRVTESVLHMVCRTMKIKNGFFYVLDPSSGMYRPDRIFPEHSFPSQSPIEKTNPFITKLEKEQVPITFSELEESEQNIPFTVENATVFIPVIFQNAILGFLVLGKKLAGAFYSVEDLELLSTVAIQAAIALENGRLHEALTDQERMKKELELARHIQMNSLPKQQPSVPGFDLMGCSIPAMEVGGDCYDYLLLSPGSIGILIGDVAGKGLSAAMTMSMIQGFFRALISSEPSPKNLLCRINALTVEHTEDRFFATAVYAVLDAEKRNLVCVRAGHTPIFHYQKSNRQCTPWIPPGLGLGLAGSSDFDRTLREEQRPLGEGDVVLFFTDGLTEAVNREKEMFGDNRLQKTLIDLADRDAKGIVKGLLSAVYEFSGHRLLEDDITMVVVKAEKHASFDRSV